MALVLLALAAGPLAAAQARKGFGSDRLLWATVNVCDTKAHPNTIGIRASMPGTESGREAMFMRIQAQYLSAEDRRWHNVPGEGDSRFLALGSAEARARQKGRSIRIAPKTDRVLLRGMVTFEWRLRGEVVRRAHRRTHKGHRSNAGADPAGYSAANCTLRR